MSDFEELKKRTSPPVQPAAQLHAPSKVAVSPAKGAHAAHDALKLPPDRHLLKLGNPLLTYRDPVGDLRRKGEPLEPPMPSLKEMEATMPPQTLGGTLSDYLRAMKDVFSRR